MTFLSVAMLASLIRLSAAVLTALGAVCMSSLSWLSALPTTQGVGNLVRRYCPGAASLSNVFLRDGLLHLRRPAKTKGVPQIEAVGRVIVPAKVVLADLPAAGLR